MSTFPSWKSFEDFSVSVKKQYRYIRTAKDKKFLNILFKTSKNKQIVLKNGQILYRAQKGFDEKEERDQDKNILTEIIDLPYGQKRMIPTLEKSKSGRVNPAGILCLYLADDLETALAEVRPWMSEKISIAKFKITRDIKIIDFSNIKPLFHFYFEEPDEKVREEEVWNSISRAFSQPVNVEDQEKDYIPTQIISELFKSKGFDGIKYKSMLASGNNYALFNIEDAIPITGVVCKIKKIKYNFKQDSNIVEYSHV